MNVETKKEFAKKFFAGMFLILGIILIFVFIFTIGKDKGLAQKKFQIAVMFNHVGGLIEGAPVRLSGVTVGNVATIDFLAEEIQGRRVRVTLNIFNKYKKQLERSTRFAIKTEGILGEKLIEIYSENNVEQISLDQPIIGVDPLDVQDLAPVFITAAESFTKTADEMSQINMVELTDVMRESSEALLETSEGINAIISELDDIAKKSRRLIDRIEQKVIDGDLFKVF